MTVESFGDYLTSHDATAIVVHNAYIGYGEKRTR